MTYGPGSERPQHYPPGGQQPPGGPGWGPPPPSGPQWTGPPPPPQGPPRKRPSTPLILILVGVLALGGVITAILLASGGGESRLAPTGSPVSTTSAATESTTTGSGGSPQGGGSRPLPPPTPTGKSYSDEPAVGACVDIARGATGLVLYQADCADPAASLILDNKQPQKCQGTGFWGLRGFSGQAMCFTYNVSAGECVDLDLPRRAPCTATPANGPKGKITITEIHHGEQDGTQCASPTQFLQVGKGEERGIACYTPTITSGGSAASGGSAPPIPSR